MISKVTGMLGVTAVVIGDTLGMITEIAGMIGVMTGMIPLVRMSGHPIRTARPEPRLLFLSQGNGHSVPANHRASPGNNQDRKVTAPHRREL